MHSKRISYKYLILTIAEISGQLTVLVYIFKFLTLPLLFILSFENGNE